MNGTHRIYIHDIIDEQWIVASRNVIVRLHGTSGRDEALLINAHYGTYLKENLLVKGY